MIFISTTGWDTLSPGTRYHRVKYVPGDKINRYTGENTSCEKCKITRLLCIDSCPECQKKVSETLVH